MKQESIFTKCSLGILVLVVLIIGNELIQLVPFHISRGQGLLFILIAEIFSIIGIFRRVTKLSASLSVINIILLFSPQIYWYINH